MPEYHATLNLTVMAKDITELAEIAEDASYCLMEGKPFRWKLTNIEVDDLEEA
jgi:hypothetical protein